MARFFDFYDPLEKRYVFNSFLVVVALVEVLILVFTLIWQMDEGVFAEQVEQVRVVPFPWKEYLLAAFCAPLVLLFLFGLIVQGFELICREGQPSAEGRAGGWAARLGRGRYLLGLAGALALGGLIFFWGEAALYLITAGIKSLGLGGAYLLIALMALALLYLPLRLLLRYRLQKKAMEYQYLKNLAERHGVILVDPKLKQELAGDQVRKNNFPASGKNLPLPPNSREDADS